MHGRKSTLLRSITAIGLVALLLFIHAVKVLHTHHNCSLHLSAAGQTEKVYMSGGSLICSICDFEYVRDAVVPDCTITIQPPAVELQTNSEFLFTIPAPGVLTIAARGPPATA